MVSIHLQLENEGEYGNFYGKYHECNQSDVETRSNKRSPKLSCVFVPNRRKSLLVQLAHFFRRSISEIVPRVSCTQVREHEEYYGKGEVEHADFQRMSIWQP